MPVLSGRVDPRGLLVDVTVMLTPQRVAALKKTGHPFAGPVPAVGLIDTGASGSCLDLGVLGRLGIQPTGSAAIHTPSTGTQYETRDQYDVSLTLGANQQYPLTLVLPVIGSSFASEGFHALIGRDVLCYCVLTYHGHAAQFALMF
jgi:hypothetical protein